jgi:DNA-binding response OmpR family regulator
MPKINKTRRQNPVKGDVDKEKYDGKLINFPHKVELPQVPKRENKSILVVDDEPHMVKLLRLNLEPEGYHVLEASNGESAYRLTLETKPDIVLLDVAIPEKNGIEVCKAIKGNPELSHIPVILITARGEGARKASMECGADLFMTKPFSPLRLLAEIRRIANKAVS